VCHTNKREKEPRQSLDMSKKQPVVHVCVCWVGGFWVRIFGMGMPERKSVFWGR